MKAAGLPKDTCLQCGQTRAQVKEKRTICATVGGYKYVEIMDEWPKHHWRDWSDEELGSINPEHRGLYRRADLHEIQYAACEHTPRGHNLATATMRDYGVVAGQCIDCGQKVTA